MTAMFSGRVRIAGMGLRVPPYENAATTIRRMAGRLTDLDMDGSVWGDGGAGKS